MADTMAKPDARTQLNSIRATSVKGLVDPQEVARRDDRLIITATLARINLSAKAAALTAGTHPSEWSNAIAGRGRLDWGWLWLQDEAFWAEFWPLVAAAKAITTEHRSEIRRQRLVQLFELLLSEVA